MRKWEKARVKLLPTSRRHSGAGPNSFHLYWRIQEEQAKFLPTHTGGMQSFREQQVTKNLR